KQLGDLDQRAKQATQVERLEAQQAEKVAELEALRSNMQRTEESVTGLQVEVDRLRDIERDFEKARDQLDRVGEERRLSEQRWKRVHRDLKDEVRRLNRERQVMALSTQQQQQQQPEAISPSSASSPAAPSSPTMPRHDIQSASVSSSGRSNSLTLGSVSTLLRAATGNSGNNGGAGRRQQLQSVAGRPHPSSGLANGAEIATYEDRHHRSRSRSSSSAASSSFDSLGVDDPSSRNRSEVVNVEYLRNVLFRFFNDKERRAQLVPVLSMLLNCKTDEIKGIQLLLQ
ncbi:hypothetical protein LPJ59_002298, partial [Coemansia sp. RSA 2399]